MPTNEKPTPWWLFFFLPVIISVSCLFIYKTFAEQPAAPIAKKLKPEYYTVETARGAELETKAYGWQLFSLSCILGPHSYKH